MPSCSQAHPSAHAPGDSFVASEVGMVRMREASAHFGRRRWPFAAVVAFAAMAVLLSRAVAGDVAELVQVRGGSGAEGAQQQEQWGQQREAEEGEYETSVFYSNVTLDDCYKYGKTNCDQDCACGWCGGELCVPGDEEGPYSPSAACPSWEYQCGASPPHSVAEIVAVGTVVLLGLALLIGAMGYCVYSKQRSKHIHHLIQTSQPLNAYANPATFAYRPVPAPSATPGEVPLHEPSS